MIRKGIAMLDNLRFRLIKMLAGKSSIALNLRIYGTIVIEQENSIVCGCVFYPPEKGEFPYLSLEDMANSSLDGLKGIPKKLAGK